jgi:hypothetical protein
MMKSKAPASVKTEPRLSKLEFSQGAAHGVAMD